MSDTVVKRLAKPDSLIVNSPYREPERYWKYDREHKEFLLVEGKRRPAGYLQATPDSEAHDDPGIFCELPLVNIIRKRVTAWRGAEWPGVTSTTRRLLQHWYDTDERQYPFFFCQLEAIETLIWLVEASPADVQGIHVPSDGGPFQRYCTKLATGGGKTIVMAMVIAWQTLNKMASPQDARFAKRVLVVAPGLTVRNRLAVLKPDNPGGDYYQEFGIVPGALMDALRQGSVGVLNWHKLDWESEEQIAKKRGVDKRGAKSDEAYVRGVLREAGLPAGAKNILVLNDEAHHAWRIPEGKKIPGVSKAEADEATKWVGGLDRIHTARGVLRCFDCSATPFVPTGKKSSDEQLFGWIVSDFGLNDAIESGLVKTPRIVVRDDAVPDAKTYKPKLYHIYRHVKDDLNGKREPHEPLPSLVLGAYHLLGKDWLATKQAWEKQGHVVPPVMISVANRTETAARIKYAFDHGNIFIEELCDPDRTLHIDSKVLESAEAQDEPVAVEAAAVGEEEGEDDAPVRKLTKKEMGELLRRQVDTVGKAGEPGGQIQNVISVAMLTEGWDARTVTHIMGLRAFSSQLLCEQVVGRGLRRTSYDDFDEHGRYKPEYVNVFGIPFSFMPHEGEPAAPPPPPPPRTEIKPLQEREADFEIRWPNVLKIEVGFRPKLELDWAKVPELVLHASDVPKLAEIAPTVDNKPDWSRLSAIDLRALAERFRYQRLAFKAVETVSAGMADEWKGSRESLVIQLLQLVEQFLVSERLRIEPELFHQRELPRRVMLALRMTEIANHLGQAIRDQNVLVEGGKEQITPVFDDARPIRSTGDMFPWFTSKPCEPTRKSHINHCVYDSTWEATHAAVLDRSEHVRAWAKNDHLGFEIWYTYAGVRKRFRPDFLVRLTNGRMLVIETKGQDSPEQKTKRRYLDEWVRAINGTDRFGEWMSDVALTPDEIIDVLERHSV